MSNIGFMQHFAKHVEELFNKCIDNPKKNPTSVEKEDYVNTIYRLEQMKKYNEIEDVKLYEILMKKICNCNLMNVAEIRRKYKKENRNRT